MVNTWNSILICLAMLVFSCCSQEKDDTLLSYFKDSPSAVVPLESAIELEQYGILVPTGVMRYQGSFIIQKGLSDNFIDILTPERQTIHCVKMGRGPGELIDYGSSQVCGDTLFVFSPLQKKLLILDIPSTIMSHKQITLDEFQIGPSDNVISEQMVLPVRIQRFKDRFWAVGMFGDGSLCAELSRDGEFISGISGPDLEDSRLGDADRASLNMDALVSVSPDGSRVAIAYTHIAALSLGTTRPVLSKYWSELFYQPELWFPDQQGLMVSYAKENRVAFQGLQAFDDRIYALYSGKDRVNDNENKANHCSHLLVFEWNGKPMMRYELELPVSNFWMEGNTLYGVSFYPDAKLYQFELPRSGIF